MKRLCASILALVLPFGLLAGAGAAGAAAVPAADDLAAGSAANTIRFELGEVNSPGDEPTFRLELSCGGEVVATARLAYPDRDVVTVPHDAAGESCRVVHSSQPVPGRVDEVTHTVSSGADALARRTWYAEDARGSSSEFRVPSGPAGDLTVRVDSESLASDQVGVPVRAMAFNIWRSGTLDDAPGGAENLRQLIEFVRSQDPDILFMVETYGSGQQILEGLNATLPEQRRYTGHRITNEPDQEPDGDNLWLFTRFDVDKLYPRGGDGDLTSFNFGGARLKLPNGQRLHAFPTWLYHEEVALPLANQAALEEALGLDRSHTEAEIVASDEFRRLGMARTLLDERLPEYLATDPQYADAPVLLAGDLNTLSAQDWSERFASAPGHQGLVLDWPVTGSFADAGFVDTYRWANPDAARYPGRTWSPVVGYGYAPGRIDYVMARGEQIRVLNSYTVTRRLPEHRDFEFDQLYPFYSDHGAVITDLLVRGPGTAEFRSYTTDEPEDDQSAWPDPPPGSPIAAEELSATATTEQAETGLAGFAVDGDYTTHWHSRYTPEVDPPPHELTVDLGSVRQLSGVRYQPRVVGNANGTWSSGTVLLSEDGENWQPAADFDWEPTGVAKNIEIGDGTGMPARYLRVRVDFGLGGFSSASELIPYHLAPTGAGTPARG